MAREIFIVRGSDVVWRGTIAPAQLEASTREYFEEAWRRALQAGAVDTRDAALVQFRSLPPQAAIESF